jgi:hypothetical protein
MAAKCASQVTGADGTDENYRISRLVVVAASTGQNDSGRFQLDSRDEGRVPGVNGEFAA